MSAATISYDLTDPGIFSEGVPHHIFDELRERQPVYGQPHPLGGMIWSLTRNVDVRGASTNFETFSSSGGIVYPNDAARAEMARDNMMFNDPPNHSRLRGYAAKAFAPPVVARFEEWIKELCIKILDEVEAADGEFDAIRYISAALPSQVIASILGVPEKDRPRMVQMVMETVSEFDPDIGPERAAAGYRESLEFLMELRELKRREPGVDMITQLATPDPSDPAPLTDREYTETAATLMHAGFETTHTLIAQSLLLAAQNTDVAAALATPDRKILSRAVDELLRYVTPANYFGRTVRKDVEIGGQRLKKGDFAMLWFTAANRDPAVFENPHNFDMNRPKRPHASFGGGSPHFCIGNHLAKLEVELLFQEVARRNLKLELAGKPRRLPGIFINGLRSLPMRVVR